MNNTFNLANQTVANIRNGGQILDCLVFTAARQISIAILSDASTAGTRSTTLTVDGGTFNISGHNIGSAASPLTTVNLNSGSLNNAATIAAKTINIMPAITITGTPNFNLADGGTLTSSLPAPLALCLLAAVLAEAAPMARR